MLYQDWDLELTGKRIRITPMRAEDAEAYGRLMFGRMYDQFAEACGGPPPTGLEDILAHTASDETHALRLPDDDAFIGWITLQKDLEAKPDIGISLVPEQRNRGLGTEAIVLFVNRLYAEYGIPCVYARVSVLNPQSRKAFEKVGAVADRVDEDCRMKPIREQMPEEKEQEISMPKMIYYHIDLPASVKD